MAVEKKPVRDINIGLFGLGNIGTGVVKVLEKNRELIRKKAAYNINIKKICVKNLSKHRDIEIKRYSLTDDEDEIIDDSEIDVIVELIGGVEQPCRIITKAILKGKNIVTANKSLMAAHGRELMLLANEHSVKINFEAAVAGCIPIIKSLLVSLSANNIRQVSGIINGTCNYILSKMSKEGTSYEKALETAIKKGFAEPDPSFDVKGLDAAQKLALLTMISFNTHIHPDEIFIQGIEEIKEVDIKWAKANGFLIKHIATANSVGNMISCRVEPLMIRKNHLFANVDDEINAIEVRGDLIGEQLYIGKGAGRLPTASTVVSDVIDLCIRREMFFEEKKIGLVDDDSLKSCFYLRFIVKEMPGVISAISAELAKKEISISSILQEKSRSSIVPIQMITHESNHGLIDGALRNIDNLCFVKAPSLRMRVQSD